MGIYLTNIAMKSGMITKQVHEMASSEQITMNCSETSMKGFFVLTQHLPQYICSADNCQVIMRMALKFL